MWWIRVYLKPPQLNEAGDKASQERIPAGPEKLWKTMLAFKNVGAPNSTNEFEGQ